MTDELPDFGKVMPAVQHVMDTLDHDAGTIQGIADRLVQAPGATLDTDKEAAKRIKGRLTRATTYDVVKGTAQTLNGIGGGMRAAVAKSLDADQQQVDRLLAVLPSADQLQTAQAPETASGPARLPSQRQPGPSAVPAVPGGPGSITPTGAPCPPDAGPFDQCSGPWQCPAGSLFWIWPGPTAPTEPPPEWVPPSPCARQYPHYQDFGWFWTCEDTAGRAYFAQCPSATSAPPAPGAPPPVPPSPPPTLPPTLPPIVPPLPHLPAPVCRSDCGPIPDGAPAQRVYVVPWLDCPDPIPSVYSDCGKKQIADSRYLLFPASDMIDRLSFEDGLADYAGPGVTSDLPPREDDRVPFETLAEQVFQRPGDWLTGSGF